MSLDAKYLYVVMMDVDPDKEDLFNKTYDEEHIPILLKVPGVISAARYKTSDQGVPRYLAIYELESPEVPHSEAFRQASDSGEWPTKVRPYCKNRSRIVYTQILPPPKK
ncbi:MAG TPA: hypothetical protein VNP04_27390 [Alphaproteobacteria bacterium]|nr:hypothetical protein [Alphaproteobacteria bacterium]